MQKCMSLKIGLLGVLVLTNGVGLFAADPNPDPVLAQKQKLLDIAKQRIASAQGLDIVRVAGLYTPEELADPAQRKKQQGGFRSTLDIWIGWKQRKQLGALMGLAEKNVTSVMTEGVFTSVDVALQKLQDQKPVGVLAGLLWGRAGSDQRILAAYAVNKDGNKFSTKMLVEVLCGEDVVCSDERNFDLGSISLH